MSKSVLGTRRRREGDLPSHTPCPDGERQPADKLVQRHTTGGHHLLNRILNTPRLEQVVPRLQPGLLHRVIQTCGLEDCGEIVALATPEQLAHIFDLDLWRATKASLDEQFDADRFGVWIEVLVEVGVNMAAQKLAGMDVSLVVAGLAQHLLVYDRAAVTPYETLDGEQVEVSLALDERLTADVGGYVLVARRADSWEAIIEVLMALGAEHPDYFHKVMGECRTLSDSGREIDGLDDLLAEQDQAMFDLAVDREGRREKQGYVTPAQARAFLQMSRQFGLGSNAKPLENPIARAYFRDLSERMGTDVHGESGLLAVESEVSSTADDTVEGIAAVFDVLLEAGVIEQAPRALLGGAEDHAPRLNRIHAHMQYVFDHDPAAYSTRSEELAYLANTLVAGCAVQGRPFTAQEASDAAVAVCNLGLENLPSQWLPANKMSLPNSFLVDHDLISVFQVGWAVLYNDVSMYAAEQLIEALTRMRCGDRETQMGLDILRIKLAKHWRAGEPWHARDALDVIMILDIPAWAALLALIDEFPVLHAVIGTSKDSQTRSVRVSDFEFISENSHIALVREFMLSLPEILRG